MNLNGMSEVIAFIFILSGILLSLLSSFGFLRLPDVYTRAHAVTKSTTLGLLCILLGAFFYLWIEDGMISIRLLLGIIFVFLTAPVGGHLIARSAHRSGVGLANISVKDELKDDIEKWKQQEGANEKSAEAEK